MLGPDGLERTKTFGRVNVSNETNHDHWGSLNDGHRLNNLLLVNLWFNKNMFAYQNMQVICFVTIKMIDIVM